MRRLLLLLPLACYAQIPQSYQDRLAVVEKTLARSYNAPAQISSGLSLQGDVFYWTARELGLEYALKTDQITAPPLFNPSGYYAVQALEFNWDFGLRAGIGYNTKDSRWDFGALWTRFLTKAHDRSPTPQPLLPIWSNPDFLFPFQPVSQAQAHWHLEYNQLDLNLGYSFYVGKYFILRPFLGPSFLWIKQHYHLEYAYTSFFPRNFVGTDHIKMHNDFQGTGLHTGCDLLFCFKHGFSIYGKADVGLYAGEFHLKRKEKFIDPAQVKQGLHAKRNLHLASPTAALGIGLRFDRGFSHNRYSCTVKLMWEQLMFFGQNQLFRFVTGPATRSNYVSNQGDLILQGGTFSCAFVF